MNASAGHRQRRSGPGAAGIFFDKSIALAASAALSAVKVISPETEVVRATSRSHEAARPDAAVAISCRKAKFRQSCNAWKAWAKPEELP